MKEGWVVKPLGEVLTLEYGRPLDAKLRVQDGAYSVFGANGEISRTNNYYHDKPSIVVGRKGSVGALKLTDARFWPLDVTYFVVFDAEDYDLRFLFFLLEMLKLPKLAKGVKPGLNRNDVYAIKAGFPSLAEQKRIVAKLDEAFEAIASAKEKAEQNLLNARALFDSYLADVFSKRGEGWTEKPLGEIGKISMCKRIFKDQTKAEGDIPFYKIGTFGKEADAFIERQIYLEYRTKYSFPKKGDVLISASGTIGRRVIYDGMDAYFQDSNIVWVSNDEMSLLNQYLYHFYGACEWGASTGATISRLYNDDLRRIVVRFPLSLNEQQQLISKINALSDKTQHLESIYQQKINALDELKQSLLHQAFSGEL